MHPMEPSIRDTEPSGEADESSVEALQRQLEDADPADAPDIAESIAVRLGRRLDDEGADS